MHRGLIALGIVAIAAFVGALVMLETHNDPAGPDAAKAASVAQRDPAHPTQAPARSGAQGSAEEPSSPPPGLRLGNGSRPNARSNAQAILDDTLVELRRLDASQQTLARDVYMRGHSAAERVEDELDDDDEPGRAELRAHEEALKDQLRRIYEVEGTTQRP